METEYLQRLCNAEERGKSNSHRLDDLERLADAIHTQGQQLAVMCAQLQQQGSTLTELTNRVASLEQRPAKRWDAVVAAIIAAVVGLAVGLLITGHV